jgi:mannose-6-phosphate isomerase-like protein (cupin superfamily)
VIRDENQFVVSVDEVEPTAVRREEGWRDMDFRLLVTRERSGFDGATLFRARFSPDAVHERHTHGVDEVFYIISGHCMIGCEGTEVEAGAGTVQYVPANKVHWLRNIDPVEPVEVVGLYLNSGSLEEAGYTYVGPVPGLER